MNVRIAKFIADCGAASRRRAEELIAQGKVAKNDVIITSPVCFVDVSDVIKVNGKEISARKQTELYAFHKPLNTMTTAADTQGRKTIYDCMPSQYKNLKYIGRLDFKTTGLLLLTNDGELARKLTLPMSNISRTYLATVNFDEHTNLDRARRGITIAGITYRPMDIKVLKQSQKSAELSITITEGKKNEIRIVLSAVGAGVKKLHRIKFGNIELGKISVGNIVKISQKTIDTILKSL